MGVSVLLSAASGLQDAASSFTSRRHPFAVRRCPEVRSRPQASTVVPPRSPPHRQDSRAPDRVPHPGALGAGPPVPAGAAARARRVGRGLPGDGRPAAARGRPQAVLDRRRHPAGHPALRARGPRPVLAHAPEPGRAARRRRRRPARRRARRVPRHGAGRRSDPARHDRRRPAHAVGHGRRRTAARARARARARCRRGAPRRQAVQRPRGRRPVRQRAPATRRGCPWCSPTSASR